MAITLKGVAIATIVALTCVSASAQDPQPPPVKKPPEISLDSSPPAKSPPPIPPASELPPVGTQVADNAAAAPAKPGRRGRTRIRSGLLEATGRSN